MQHNEFPEEPDGTTRIGRVLTVVVTLGRLPALRALITQTALRLGMSATAVRDAIIAINEVATNAVTHGQTPAWVRIWRAAAELVVEVRDYGRWKQPGAEVELPADTAPGGRGLWIAHTVASDVTIHTGDTGTRITLRFGLN